MCAQSAKMTALPADGAQGLNVQTNPQLEQELEELGRALASRQVEAICGGYLAVRRLVSGGTARELLDRINQQLGPTSETAIVAAFGHRHCFMCEDGAVDCPSCRGTGLVDGYLCPHCDGLGLETCTFCSGTGWSDKAEIPEEIRRMAVAKRVTHVLHEMERLEKITPDQAKLASDLASGQRRHLQGWLLRIQARSTNLLTVINGEIGSRLRQGSEKSSSLLAAMRPSAQRDA